MRTLFDRMNDIPENYGFIQTRIRQLWPSWVKAINEMKEKYPKQFNNYRKLNVCPFAF